MWYLRNTLRYGVRYLLRDNAIVLKRPSRTLQRTLDLSPAARWRYALTMVLWSLKHAVHCIPFYSRFSEDVRDLSPENVIDFLHQIPVVERNDLLGNPDLFYPNNGTPKPWWFTGLTSGTTGTPLKVFRSYNSILFEGAFIRRHWKLANFRSRQRRATLRGDFVVPLDRSEPPFWYFNPFDNQLVVSSRHLREEFMAAIIEKLVEFGPAILEAYPSTCCELAKFVARHGHSLRVPFVYTGSEILYDHQRDQIQESLGACVMDFYGMAERVAFASECRVGRMHLNTDYSFVELLDEDNIPTGGPGFITGTTFHNLAMPLIRFKMSDLATIIEEDCSCGCTFPIVDSIQGKFEDIIYGSDGNPVSPSVLTFFLKGAEFIRKSQVAQTDEGVWEIRVVPEAGYSPEVAEKLIENVRTRVDSGVSVSVRTASDIPRTKAGKFRWVVNEWMGGRGGGAADEV